MDAKVRQKHLPVTDLRPSQEDAEAAVRTLLSWAGDNPAREGLRDTPRRVASAFKEYFAGYGQDPADILDRVFEDVGGYDDMVMLKDIPFTSHCEHHIAPFFGRAHVAYLPTGGVVGISKIARTVEAFARRLQTQETMTVQIAHAVCEHLGARGSAVMLEAVHTCMSMRGVQKPGVATVTMQFVGEFKTNPAMQARFMEQLRMQRGSFTP
jgi:GTP cyclohydrolase I